MQKFGNKKSQTDETRERNLPKTRWKTVQAPVLSKDEVPVWFLSHHHDNITSKKTGSERERDWERGLRKERRIGTR